MTDKRNSAKPVVIINRGGGSAGDDAVAKARAALKDSGIDADIRAVDGGDAAKEAKKAVKAGAKLIIAAGGDGTMSAVAGVLSETKVTMGLLPMGTLNHLARDLGIPFEFEKAAAILAASKTRVIDLAELNGRVFVNNSAIGLYPLMVMDREAQQERLGRSKKLAMIVASVRALVRFRHQRLSLTVNQEEKRIDTPLLFVGNNDYRTDIGAAGQRESIDDGRLCVLVMRHNNRRGLVAAAIRALFNRARSDDMIHLDNVTRLRVDAGQQSLAVSLDGEVLRESTPLDYRILPKALRVIVP